MIVSIIPDGKKRFIKCSQGDTTLRKWEFILTKGDELIEPFGSCSLICENGVEIPLVISDGKLLCDCTSELSNQSGLYDCKIKIIDGEEVIHSALINLYVEGVV